VISVCFNMPVAPEGVPLTVTQMAAKLLHLRRLRDRLFTPGLFADPAWDMLLDLVVAEDLGRSTAVSSLCIASAAPVSTALRYLHIMEQEGLIARRADPSDGRRHLVSLTPSVSQQLRQLLAEF
jgi:DNA-binding MarR family transcriptional regulator